MTREQLTNWIIRQTMILAESKGTASPAHYQIGFLASQLADAMYNDNKIASKFKLKINQLGLTKQTKD